MISERERGSKKYISRILKTLKNSHRGQIFVASEAKRPYKNDQLFLKDRIPGHRKL